MRVSPALLLFLLMVLIFSPTIIDWATQGGLQWYRPYLLWLLMIIFVAWTVRQAQKHQSLADEDKSETQRGRQQ